MKKLAIAIALSLVSSLSAAKELVGVWELVSGNYVDGSGTLVDYKDLDMQALKVISDSHFSFTSMKGGDFWASGTGTYELADGKYTETLRYNSFGQATGAQFAFTTRIEDSLWYNERWEDGKRVEYEVWQRVE
ncbi:hypothetical protein Mag101_15340 [Microbulbifer agarilyticus]|uniref:DUF4488 domain-containing protein n=1 Tax=Microbulbifer agarilyticus TaxID=260552 RepID=A0A1Q2M9H2_9GAMM|nr:hypothetical protein [Microbulbifer agarilyticus]AQQ68852.1 hypothetical protein Mag101_15340 [Microbulbifer agarilyticus]